MARSPREAIVIVLDIGHYTSQAPHQDGKTFLELAKTCVTRIMERKIFSQSKDEIALVLVGTEGSDNASDYPHVSEVYRLSNPSWTLLKQLDQEIVGTDILADWLDGVVVAMDILKEETEGKKFTGKKIVLFTNCAGPVSQSRVDLIIKAIQAHEMELTTIGPDVISPEIKEEDEGQLMDFGDSGIASNSIESQNGIKKEKSKHQKLGERLLIHLVEKSGGIICSFDDALPQLMFYQKKAVRPTPWNVCLDIGPDIKIPVSGYKKIAEATVPSWKTVSTEDQSVPVDKERTYFKKDKTAVEKTETIEGYYFGSTLVPYSETDKQGMGYVSGLRCLSVLGFTKFSFIPRHLLMGTGVYYFFPHKDKPDAIPAFTALVQSLKELDMVAVVRRIYNNNNAPYVGALFPKVKDNKMCLVYLELPYSEDIREFVFPSLTSESSKPTEEQLNAIDFLIDNMDLMKTEEDGELVEAFCPKRTLLPYHQYLYRYLAHRALHPEKKEPLPVGEDIKKMFKCPFESKIGYKQALEIIKKRFVLIEQKPKNPYRKRKKRDDEAAAVDDDVTVVASTSAADGDANVVYWNISDLAKPAVTEIGTVKPEEDFHTLLDKGEPLMKVCSQMQKVILNLVLVSFGADNFPKALSALKTLRGTCADLDPSSFNSWLPEFKTAILDRGKDSFWQLVTENKVGLITADENPESSVTVDEAETFLKIEEEAAPSAIQDLDFDADDLLNEM